MKFGVSFNIYYLVCVVSFRLTVFLAHLDCSFYSNYYRETDLFLRS